MMGTIAAEPGGPADPHLGGINNLTILNGGVTGGREVQACAGEEAGPVLHPLEPALDQGGQRCHANDEALERC